MEEITEKIKEDISSVLVESKLEWNMANRLPQKTAEDKQECGLLVLLSWYCSSASAHILAYIACIIFPRQDGNSSSHTLVEDTRKHNYAHLCAITAQKM